LFLNSSGGLGKGSRRRQREVIENGSRTKRNHYGGKASNEESAHNCLLL
jgi:hypothetical protein